MKILLRYVLLTLLIAAGNEISAQDSTKRAPAQKPFAKPAVGSVAPAKQYSLKVNPWAQLKYTTDSLKRDRQKLSQAEAKATSQAATIQALQDSIKSMQAKPENIDEPTNDVEVMGSTFPFATYNAAVLSALLFFALAFAFVVFRSGKYRNEAHYRINLYKELSDEYQAHKVKANEKEKKLARELQDERNKLDELKGR